MPTRIIFGPQPPESAGPSVAPRGGEIRDEIDVSESPKEVLEALGRGSSFARLTDTDHEDPVWVNVAHVQRFRETR